MRYDRLGEVTADRPLVVSSLVLNWVLGPALMFVLAWIFLPDLPEFRTGIILVGLARCIAMVLIWNTLACGDDEAAAVLVVLNSVFQVAAYSLLGYFYLELLPGWLGLRATAVDFELWDDREVGADLPRRAAGARVSDEPHRAGERKGDAWYEREFLPRIGPFALYSLLFTIVVLFAIQGEAITSQPLDVVRIAVPLLVYFALMWTAAFAWGRRRGCVREDGDAGVHGGRQQLRAGDRGGDRDVRRDLGAGAGGVVGPLIEVPALVALVYVSLWAQRRLFGGARRGAGGLSTVRGCVRGTGRGRRDTARAARGRCWLRSRRTALCPPARPGRGLAAPAPRLRNLRAASISVVRVENASRGEEKRLLLA